MVCCLETFVVGEQLYIYNTAERDKAVCSTTVITEMAEESNRNQPDVITRYRIDVFTHFIASRSRKLLMVFLHFKIALLLIIRKIN